MNPDQSCSSDQWSMVTSAASISQLAGVLGGFLITAIALLFDRNSREAVYTLAMFSSAVLILMLDSYLFSIISGTVVPDDGDRQGICAIAWSQGVLATGMLALGTTALFGGLGWMLASHAVSKAADQHADELGSYCFLGALGGWLTFGSTMATTLIMSETAIDYLQFMYHRPPGLLTSTAVTGFAAVIILVDLWLVATRTRTLRRSLLDVDNPTLLNIRSIRFVTIAMAGLAVLASWLTMSVNRFPESWLTTPKPAAVVVVVILGFLAPSIISTGICHSVASTDD
ncbi:hypothetical protein [Mycobacterium pinniadriaticum]|uniref:Uncharacterized protein n=2 Tax=Mycobacterium pinniadriaticum TaxID=2994102 RepID=A0ABT3SAS6_9MYCO|nr:hypothetical protein [Mycobacterium pinniadriaticum]MCX2936621.1 hypothetical protein [Mycobacterium pinniadriaticum]